MAHFDYLIAVGSNLGDRHKHIGDALKFILQRGHNILKTSTLMESKPIGAADQMFVNGAFVCRSHLEPHEMMSFLIEVEKDLGRTREVRWGNRTIDLDILMIRDHLGIAIAVSTEHLTVPHPRMFERDFVMIPAREIWSFDTVRTVSEPSVANKQLLLILVMGLFLRWIFAALIPFGNDEAYYWDWGRAVQLSYFDHPPMVSWMAWLGEHLVWFDHPTLAGRLLIPVCHAVSTWCLWDILKRCTDSVLSRRHLIAFLLITQFVPAFSLGGIMLMPDAGLIFFTTVACWLVLKWWDIPQLKIWHGIGLGLMLGGAGLSKYHAVLMAGGMLSYLLLSRRSRLKQEWTFWLAVVGAGMVAILPVLIWNADHAWASFLFQGKRGISGDGIRLMPAVRTLLGEIAFVGPAFVASLWFAWRRNLFNNGAAKFLVATALPMLIVLKLFSFTSQTLPHWSMPSLWLLTPMVGLALAELRVWRVVALSYGAILCVIAPLILSTVSGRHALIAATGNRPGGLGELTLWDEASRDMEFQNYIHDASWIESDSPGSCSVPWTWASPRWFTVAQVAANTPGRPVVQTLDPDKLSYYHFRTPPGSWQGCPTVVLAEESHIQGLIEAQMIDVLSQKRFVIAGHEDRPVIVMRGIRSSQRKRAETVPPSDKSSL